MKLAHGTTPSFGSQTQPALEGLGAPSDDLFRDACEEAVRRASPSKALETLADFLRQAFDLYALGWCAIDATRRLTHERQFAHYLPHSEADLEHVLLELGQRAATTLEAESSTTQHTLQAAHTNSSGQSFALVAVRSQTAVMLAAFQNQPAYSSLFETALVTAASVYQRRLIEEGADVRSFEIGGSVAQLADTPLSPPILKDRTPDPAGHAAAGEDTAATVERELAMAAVVIDLSARIESCECLDDALQRAVDESVRHVGCEFVAIGLLSKHSATCRHFAVSDPKLNDRTSAAYRCLEAALDEIVLRGESTQWPPLSSAERHGLLTHSRLLTTLNQQAIVGAPLRTADQTIVGAWLFVGRDEVGEDARYRNFAEAAGYRIGGSLRLQQRAERSVWQRLWHRASASLQAAPKHTVALAIAACAGLIALPAPHRVSCDCELQPVVRRYVAAPFEGSLEESLVEPGETVAVGQLLARMDAREISWELAGIDAEHSRAGKERDTHMAKQDIGAAEISRYDIERLQNRRKLLTYRTENLEIRSPIAGLVISGDLKKSEGIPLKTGDRLFEIAPLERMLVEVAIPEPDIRHAQVDQTVAITLDAFPGTSWDGTVKRIHPRSEILDEQHVFIAEVELENPQGNLRPGMKGSAKISIGYRALGWIALHRPWEQFLMWMGW